MSAHSKLAAVLIVICTLLGGGMCQPATFGNGSDQPNVLLIILDATRADRLSLYGHSRPTSPRLDELAAEGVTYDNCFATASWTLPSLSSIFTGKYVRDHGVSSQNLSLAPRHKTMAEMLQKKGYRTAGFSCNAWVGEFSALNRGFETFEDVWKGLNSSSSDAGAEETNELVLDWIDFETAGKPFFVFINYFEPHFPYRPPVPFDQKFLPPGASQREVAEIRSWESPRELGVILNAPGYQLSESQIRLIEAQYDGEIAYLDSKVGELVDGLRERKILDNTLVLILADHGEHLGDHGMLDHKMSLYDPLIRVPLIARLPGRFPAGERVRSMVQTIDILPTVLDACGIDAPVGTAASLPTADDPRPSDRTVFAEFAQPSLFIEVIEQKLPGVDHSAFDRSLTVARTSRHKFIWASDGRHELYDIVEDPNEQVNLIQKRRDVARDLLKQVLDFRSKSR